MSSPLDSYAEAKVAAPGTFGRMSHGFSEAFTPERIGGAVAGAAVAGGLMHAGTAAQKIVGAITKQRDFRKMMELSPDLVEEHDRNPTLFNQQYSSLRRLNPVFAKDPVIAGTYMRQMSMSPESAGKVLVESIGSAPQQTKMPPWAEAGASAFNQHKPLEHAKFQAEAPERQMRQQQLKNSLEEYEQRRPVRDMQREEALNKLQGIAQTD